MKQTTRLVGKVDVVFDVWSSGEKLGQMRLSKGGVDWWPKNSKRNYHRGTWEQVRDVLEQLPVKAGP